MLYVHFSLHAFLFVQTRQPQKCTRKVSRSVLCPHGTISISCDLLKLDKTEGSILQSRQSHLQYLNATYS